MVQKCQEKTIANDVCGTEQNTAKVLLKTIRDSRGIAHSSCTTTQSIQMAERINDTNLFTQHTITLNSKSNPMYVLICETYDCDHENV